MPDLPADEYECRLARSRASAGALDRADARLAGSRLSVFVAGVAVAALGWNGVLSWWWLLVPAVVFLVLVVRHDRVIRARRADGRAVRFYERGLARIADQWAGTGGETGARFRDDDHLYANDLDLFGEGSLFELLSIARTRAGESRLAGWLTAPSTREAIRKRQDAVDELAPRLDLREDLARAETRVGGSVDEATLVRWAGEPSELPVSGTARAMALLLTLAMLAAGAWWLASGAYGPLLVVILAQVAVAVRFRRPILHVLHGADAPSRELDAVAAVLGRVEQESFASARLSAVQRELRSGDVDGSAAIARLRRLVELHDWEHNLIFAPIAAVLFWSGHVALAIEAWRRRYGPLVRGWLDAVGEVEALESLAAYRYEHPGDVWPDVVAADDDGMPAFDATGITHPLLPRAHAVRNDVRLGAGAGLLVVSGSNMSGKSTLLRTVGINAVLALAGAPVRAAALRLTPVAIGATLRVQDSLQEGRSRFYAEITRVRAIVAAGAGPLPLLFLFDELFQGTNSHDRLGGSTGVLRSLLGGRAIGLITTHDLAVTSLADTLGSRAVNVHFEDRLEGDELAFDYRMKPGPVGRGNGLALMRAVGLDVDAV